MRKVIRKWFWVWDFDKEEKWLNEMADRGLALVAVGWCRYEFEDCVPGEYSDNDSRIRYLTRISRFLNDFYCNKLKAV